MAGEWHESALGDVIELKRGYDLPQQRRRPGSAPIVSSSGVTDYHTEAMVKGPGVVTGRYGTIGQVYFIDKDYWPLNTTLYVRDFKGNDPRFISYFLRGVNFLAYSDKAAVPGLNRNHLHQARVIIPSDKNEQRAIAHILGTLDDKIELNRRMNETLEAMARVLFKDWFVDFGPVRAKMENREPYLPREVWDLFPDRLVASELGEIPEGWKQNTLADLTILNPESWSRKAPPSEIEYVDLANTKWGQIEKTSRMTWEHAPSRAQRILRPGDSILGTVRPGNGSYALIGSDGLTGSTGFAVLRPRHDAGKAVVYLAATSGENIDRLAHLADGGAYPAVSPEAVLATPLVLPEINTPKASILQAFSDTVDALLDSIEQRKSESKNLAGMRDTLLPKLISGELRVPNVLRQDGEEVVA